MARHNREGRGEDQRGTGYVVGYQPDWFRQIKVTRDLESGRQSTKTLFRNPEPPQANPGTRVRTQIASDELGLELEVSLQDPNHVVRRIIVETEVQGSVGEPETIVFSLGSRGAEPAPPDD
ncbi:MAG: hypothetical protein M3409_04675 [Gemmatimonadota bacterium]|jgi:hypothetical protein|nr:hypothetical protein [Gemmatimonadota bacterium]